MPISIVRPESNSTVHSQSWIKAKGSLTERLVFQNAKAYGDIQITYAAIAGQILSKFGNVYASHSSLGDVLADKNIILKNSTAKKVESDYGCIKVKAREKTDEKMSSVAAGNHVSLKRVSVEGEVKSRLGHVVAKQSDLSNVHAYKSIVLFDSSAKDLTSEYGSVTAEKSTLEKVQACANISLLNSAAADVVSEFGSVTAKQTDGARRSVSHITALGQVIAQGCDVEEVTLHVDQDEKGTLDITDSQVGKIAVKVNDLAQEKVDEISPFSIWTLFFGPLVNVKSFYANVNGKEFHSLDAYNEYLKNGKEADAEVKPKQFSLLIKGQEEMPANISFEGFETDEISSEKTDEGLLVKGQKKQ